MRAAAGVYRRGFDDGGDEWADPVGEFLGAVDAGPVYRLLGKKDLGTTKFPPMETGLLGGDLAFRQHQFGHTPAPNWPYFSGVCGAVYDGGGKIAQSCFDMRMPWRSTPRASVRVELGRVCRAWTHD